MKRTFLAAGAVALSGCMLFALAGCGSCVSEAKNMVSDKVTEAEWDAAVKKTATSQGGGTAQLTAAQSGAELPNFKTEFGLEYRTSIETESYDGGIISIAATSVTIEGSATVTLTVDESRMYMTMDYNFEADASDNVKAFLEVLSDQNVNILYGSGKAELYVDLSNNTSYMKDGDGAWGKTDFTALSSVAGNLYIYARLSDVSALAEKFAEYEYSDEHKGYVKAKADASAGSGSGQTDGAPVYKFKDGSLAAVYADDGVEGVVEGFASFDGAMSMGYLYTYGGQSVTVPEGISSAA